jgi:ankyrin repeat protein
MDSLGEFRVHGSENTLKKLLDAGVPPTYTDADGFTTLHRVIAAVPNTISVETAIRVVNHPEVDVNAVTIEDGDTPLMMTTDESIDVMNALIDKDADINATNMRGRSVVNQAILLGQFKKAIKLIEKGAKITKEEVDEIRKVRPGQLDSINAVINARNAERSGGRRRKTRKARKTHNNRKTRKYSHKKN